MSAGDRPTALIDELRAALIGLEHARRALGKGDGIPADDLWPRLERCARRFEELERGDRDAIKPVMLALLDELERSIAIFGAEHRKLGDKLRSTSQNMAAGVAYRQTKSR
ncbi:MAG: hypothetical protein ACR2QJ_15125 [Geminicoccaceae bacterium]